MTELLTVPLKRGSDIDLEKPLKRWIQQTFSSADQPADVDVSVSELNKMRQSVARLTERGEAGLNSAGNYFDQIVGLEAKVPANELQVMFKWKDAFDRGGLFGGRISLSLPLLSYERVCVLFNIGAFNSGVASDQNLETSEGLQRASKRLQVAAGIFAYLKDHAVAALQTDPTPDLEPETLSVISDLMLAQAQEIVTLKAISDNMKDNIIAKLCSQCDEMFANVMRSMQREAIRNLWDSDWLPNISGKQAIYKALAQYHQAKVCNANKDIGEEIARLEFSKRLFGAGIERGPPGLCGAKDWVKRVERDLAAAKKDNDFIYHERIPDEKSLAAISKAGVAKATPLAEKFGNAFAPMLFESLIPVPVHQAIAAYEVRQTEIVNREVGKLKETTTLMNELLSSMNLPAALEDTKGNELPQSLKDKADSVKDVGGVATLSKLIQELPELLVRNTEILDECERMLKEEKDSDDQLRSQFSDKWKRTPSDKLTTTFNSNAQKYRLIINNATQADKVVRGKFDGHRANIEALGGGGSQLQTHVPNATGGSGGQSLPIANNLRQQMEQVETIKAERQVIESEIKNMKPNMRQVFFDAYQKDGTISGPTISTESLARTFGPLQKQVEESIKSQEKLMEEVQKNYEVFSQQSGNGSSNARDEKLKQLAAAHDAYFELKGNLSEGTKFYNDLAQLLVTFQTKVSDFCFARKTEKDELLKDLTSAMSSLNMAPTPQAPAHHSTATDGVASKTSPARPPPPVPAPSATAPNPYAGAPSTATAPNPYAGAPTTTAVQPTANPYAGAPQNTYVGAPPAGYPQQQPTAGLPYPVQSPNMPYPQQGYAPIPQGYNPYAGAPPSYPGYPQQPGAPAPGCAGYPGYPGAPAPGYPPQYPPQNPPRPGQQQWR